MSAILSAVDLQKGKTVSSDIVSISSRPLQILSKDKKDERWAALNMDWLEFVGMNQIRDQAKRMISNYKMAYGIIEKNDYIPSVENEYSSILEAIDTNEVEITELKNYPIAPVIINTLVSEFAKRSTDVSYVAIDDDNVNEILQKKAENIEEILLRDANNKIQMQLLQLQGMENTPQYQQLQEMVANPELLKKLPEIEDFYRTNYRSIYEQWAALQHQIDVERFRIYELENDAFLDLLAVGREFFHFNMYDDDYSVELWDTITTFYHRSPGNKYVSNASYVGNIAFMTLTDVIDKYGRYIDEKKMSKLETLMPSASEATLLTSYQNDGNFYDKSISYEQNRKYSLGFTQMLAKMPSVDNSLEKLLFVEDYDYKSSIHTKLFRVTTAYWSSYRKIGLLTKIDDIGNRIEKIVTEDYEITTKPVYNKALLNEESERTLIYGEHIEWVWIKEVWGGIKISPNTFIHYDDNKDDVFPIYLGINKKKISPLRFQFKGDDNLFGAKLPVEGIIDNYRYSHSMSVIDLIKPYQIGYNIVNNQIADILLDELGTVIVLDHNTLPKHSLGEDWGQTPYGNAYIAMKNFNILPLDTSLRNTESAVNFHNYQKLDLSQTERLMGRIQLSQFFKQQALETIGINYQRLGQPIGRKQTATEYEMSVVNSYAQTEKYFIIHCDYVMPRVHEMRTQLAQYYVSNYPSYQLQLLLKNKERVLFSIDGTKLLNKDFHVYITTRANYRAMLEQIKNALLQKENSGATIFDLADIIQTETYSEVVGKLKELRERAERNAMEQMRHQEKLKDMELKAMEKEKELERDFKRQEAEAQRRNDLLIAQIRAAGYMGGFDKDQNKQSDYIDFINSLKRSEEFKEQMQYKYDVANMKKEQSEEKMRLQEKEMQNKLDAKLIDLAIAKENKNKYDEEK